MTVNNITYSRTLRLAGASVTNTVTDADITAFADISGDRNPGSSRCGLCSDDPFQGAHRARHAVGGLSLPCSA